MAGDLYFLGSKMEERVPRGLRPILIVDETLHGVIERVAPGIDAPATRHFVERDATKRKGLCDISERGWGKNQNTFESMAGNIDSSC